ncbi:hypothetical protein NDK25_23950 [Niallia taxi]|nr:hypothetical protein [Niallia taxi]MDE5055273.1 hypothetical protein [Niallia taxi]
MSTISTGEVLDILRDRLGKEGLCFLIALAESDKPLLKAQLGDRAQELHTESYGNTTAAINSRHHLDILTARLEGAGLVDVNEVGRSRLYSLSMLGNILIERLKEEK